MKTFHFTSLLSMLLTLLLFAAALPAQAQHWSAEEQEILDFTEACWEMWSHEEVDRYLSECWHAEITFWWSEHALPFGARWVERGAPFGFSRWDFGVWDMQPAAIKVYGDAAIIQYQLMGGEESTDGDHRWWVVARSDFLVREAGTWKVVAVHQHPAPEGRK